MRLIHKTWQGSIWTQMAMTCRTAQPRTREPSRPSPWKRMFGPARRLWTWGMTSAHMTNQLRWSEQKTPWWQRHPSSTFQMTQTARNSRTSFLRLKGANWSLFALFSGFSALSANSTQLQELPTYFRGVFFKFWLDFSFTFAPTYSTAVDGFWVLVVFWRFCLSFYRFLLEFFGFEMSKTDLPFHTINHSSLFSADVRTIQSS